MQIQLQPNPIIVKELRSRMRGGRPYLILSGYLFGLGLICYAVIRIFESQAQTGTAVISAHVGQGLFAALALAEILLITFLTPALTAGAISSEREQLTYDLLLATPLRPGRLLSGKLIAALSYVLLLIFAAVPLGSVILMFGGVAPKDLLKVVLLLLLTALATGMLGLLCSTIAKRTLRATIMTYLIIMIMIVGAYLIVVVRMAPRQFGPPSGSRLMAINPIAAMTSIVLQSAQGGDNMPMIAKGMPEPVAIARPAMFSSMMSSPNILLNMQPFSNLTYGVIEYKEPTGSLVLPVYRYAYVGYTLFSIACYWLASHWVRPRRRWRLGLHDLLMLGLLVGTAAAGSYWLQTWPWQP
jgi:ABC-type transport system involved in multi-copper enzyme maturation permease subunit